MQQFSGSDIVFTELSKKDSSYVRVTFLTNEKQVDKVRNHMKGILILNRHFFVSTAGKKLEWEKNKNNITRYENKAFHFFHFRKTVEPVRNYHGTFLDTYLA